jgi:hypothetical protein
MSDKRKKYWNWEQELAALTDAFASELLAAPDDEVAACLHEIGPKGRHVIEDVRRLISAADADSDEAPVSNFVAAGSPAYLTRSH